MADVLIVCVREDEPQAKALADMFERAGFSVGGAPSNDAALRTSGAAVVVWSQASIRSRPFLDAAQRVVSADKAVLACLIEPPPPDSVKDAAAFELTGWTGDPDDPALDPLFFAVDRMVNASRSVAPATAAVAAPAAPAYQLPPQPAAPRTARAAPPAPPYGRAPARTAPPEPRTPPPATLPPGFQMRSPVSTPSRPAPQHMPHAHPAPDPLNAEAEDWRAIRHSTDPADFLDFLNRYGANGAFAELAQLRLKQLEGPAQAPARPMRPQAPAAPMRQAEYPPRQAEYPARRPEVGQRRYEPPTGPGREVVLPERMRERAPADYAQREPARGGGGALRAMVLVVLLGGALYAGSVYFGLGDLLSGGGQSAAGKTDEAAANGLDPYPVVGDPANPPPERAGALSLGEAQSAAPPPSRNSAPQQTQRTASIPAAPAPAPVQSRPANTPTRSTTAPTTSQASNSAPAPLRSWSDPAETSNGASGGPVSLAPGGSNSDASTSGGPVNLASNPPPAGVSPPATTTAAPPPTVVWSRRPTAQSIGALYPRQALRDNVNGFVSLDCVIRPDLTISCVVASESPQRIGFGRAALQAVDAYQARATLSDGSSAVGARTRIQMNFRAPG